MLSSAAIAQDCVTISQVRATVFCCLGVADYPGEALGHIYMCVCTYIYDF